ncbi:hypothetical protein F9C11_05075 [Amycolatopsis sp. VS8301801F10]
METEIRRGADVRVPMIDALTEAARRDPYRRLSRVFRLVARA